MHNWLPCPNKGTVLTLLPLLHLVGFPKSSWFIISVQHSFVYAYFSALSVFHFFFQKIALVDFYFFNLFSHFLVCFFFFVFLEEQEINFLVGIECTIFSFFIFLFVALDLLHLRKNAWCLMPWLVSVST